MKKKLYKSLLWTIILLTLIMIATFFIMPKEKTFEVMEDTLISEPAFEAIEVNLKAVGDNLIHSSIYNQAKERAENGYDFSYPYESIEGIIKSADIATINQETLISPIYDPSDYPKFNSPTDLQKKMLSLGFDVFNQANNHTLDKGEKGLSAALEEWEKYPQALVTGVYKDEDDYNNIRTKDVNGIKFAFIGMTELTNGLSLPQNTPLVLLRTFEEGKIKERIEKAKEIADIVVVNVHWGVEYSHTPAQSQKNLANNMAEWGADLIIGHHPHVLQPIEKIYTSDGREVICAYSLGNFISAQSKGPRMVGGILDVSFLKEEENKKPVISEFKMIPIVTHYEKGFKNIKLYQFKDYTAELALNHGVRNYDSSFNYDFIKNTLDTVIGQEFLAY